VRVDGVVGDREVRDDPVLDPEDSGWRCRRAADRVTGAKYPSFASDGSETEGVGEITRGVAGTAFGEDIAARLKVNGRRDATRMTPQSSRFWLSALSEASIPQGINGLANEAIVGDY
jgi:hypothetical protein